VTTAPCKEVILKGDDVDLTRLPLFLHHDRAATAPCQLLVDRFMPLALYDPLALARRLASGSFVPQ
jgi:hypothetical protein